VRQFQQETFCRSAISGAANIHADTRSARACRKMNDGPTIVGGFREEPASIASAGAVDDELAANCGKRHRRRTDGDQQKGQGKDSTHETSWNETKNNLYNTILQANDSSRSLVPIRASAQRLEIFPGQMLPGSSCNARPKWKMAF